MGTQVFEVDGMTCGHCITAVTAELTATVGEASVDVRLGEPSTVTVHAHRALTADEIAAALDEAGGYILRADTLR